MTDEKDIDELFMRLAGVYLNRWTANFKSRESIEMAVYQWRIILSGFTGKELIKAFNRLKTLPNFKQWPPTAHEFRDVCRMVVNERPQKRLPILSSDPEKGIEEINKLRERFPNLRLNQGAK